MAASVVKVEGDTRLDEFMDLVENYFVSRVGCNGVNRNGYELNLRIKQLYHDMGFSVGRLKKLMDKNNQTWSSDNERSNAHIGNVVLYNGTDKVKLGFVDFDASCDTNDFSKSKLKALQKIEYDSIINSAKSMPISPRKIQMGFLKSDKKYVVPEWRNDFVLGFETGYNAGPKIGVSAEGLDNQIDFARFVEIFMTLRSSIPLKGVPAPSRGYQRSDNLIDYTSGYFKHLKEDNSLIYSRSKMFDPYGILNKNKRYQNSLLNELKEEQDYLLSYIIK